MSRQKKTGSLERISRMAVRPGEGAVIPLVPAQNRAEGDLQWLGIDLSQAPVPDRRYSADVAAIRGGSDVIRLVFGQLKPVGSGLTSVLVIKVSFRGVRQFVQSMTEVAGGLRAMMEREQIQPQAAQEPNAPTDQAVTLDSNIIAAGFSEREACMDFYYASAFAVAAVKKGAELRADPVVRVTLSSPLLLAISDELEKLNRQLPTRM